MTLLERGQAAARVLRAYLTDRGARIRYGLRQRTADRAVMEAGDHPTSYRAEWIRTSIHRVVEELQARRNEMEGRYPFYAVSQDDLKDILRGAYALVDS